MARVESRKGLYLGELLPCSESIEVTNELAYYIEGLINGAKDFIVEPLGVLLAASRFNTIKITAVIYGFS